MDAGRPSLCLAIPLLDDRESDALARTLDSFVGTAADCPSTCWSRLARATATLSTRTCSTTPCSPQWAFELDSGIYAAMNALLERATSDLILYVGAGDVILQASLLLPTGGQTKALRRTSFNLVESGCRTPNRVPRPLLRPLGCLPPLAEHHASSRHRLSSDASPRDLGGFPKSTAILADYAMNLHAVASRHPSGMDRGRRLGVGSIRRGVAEIHALTVRRGTVHETRRAATWTSPLGPAVVDQSEVPLEARPSIRAVKRSQHRGLMGAPMVPVGHSRQRSGRGRGQYRQHGLSNFLGNGLVPLSRPLPPHRWRSPSRNVRHRQVGTDHRQAGMQEVKQLVGQAEPEIVDGRSVEGQPDVGCRRATPQCSVLHPFM